MASANYMNGVMNLMNDMKRDFLIEVLKNLENKELLTDEIKEIVEKMTAEIKNNNKLPKGMKKEKKPRFSGYTLYLKEQRVVVKAENPDVKPQELTSIVAKAWKTISDEDKDDFNMRSKALKEAYFAENGSGDEDAEADSSASSGDEKKSVKKDKKEKVVKEKGAKGVKKEKVVKEKGSKGAKSDKSDKKEKVVKEKKVVKKIDSSPPKSDDEEEDEEDEEEHIAVENADSDIDL
jgi:hypothetical protein